MANDFMNNENIFGVHTPQMLLSLRIAKDANDAIIKAYKMVSDCRYKTKENLINYYENVTGRSYTESGIDFDYIYKVFNNIPVEYAKSDKHITEKAKAKDVQFTEVKDTGNAEDKQAAAYIQDNTIAPFMKSFVKDPLTVYKPKKTPNPEDKGLKINKDNLPNMQVSERPVKQTINMDVIPTTMNSTANNYNNATIEQLNNYITSCGLTIFSRVLPTSTGEPTGIIEYHLAKDNREITELMFFIDTGILYDTRVKFAPYDSRVNMIEYLNWYSLTTINNGAIVFDNKYFEAFLKGGASGMSRINGLYRNEFKNLNKHIELISINSANIDKNMKKTIRESCEKIFSNNEINNCFGNERFALKEFDATGFTISSTGVRPSVLYPINTNGHTLKFIYNPTDGNNLVVVE